MSFKSLLVRPPVTSLLNRIPFYVNLPGVVSVFILSSLCLIIASCGGSPDNLSLRPATRIVAISPIQSSLQAGDSIQFTAAGTDAATDLEWMTNGIVGGNSVSGTISRFGLYTAPRGIPAIRSIEITAKTKIHLTGAGHATVTVFPDPGPITVSVFPGIATLHAGEVQQYSATVAGTNNRGIAWLVNGNEGGTPTLGTISSTGAYTAPQIAPAVPSVTITAKSTYDAAALGTATIKIVTAIGTSPAAPVANAAYYVDASAGDDSNDGRSPTTAWRSIAKVNASYFSAGDQILFKRGGIWREQLTISTSGSLDNAITFSDYGSGSPPQILGSVAKNGTTDWTQDGTSLSYAEVASLPNIVWRDSARMTRVVNISDLQNGTEWWWDSGNKRVYIQSGSSVGHTIEIAQRANAIVGIDKNYIRIQNLDLRFANEILVAAVCSSETVKGWEVANNWLQGTAHRGISIGENARTKNQADDAKVHNNNISDVGGDPNYDYRFISVRYGDSPAVDDNVITFTGLASNSWGYGIVVERTTANGGSGAPEVLRNTITGSTGNGGYNGSAIALFDTGYARVNSNNINVVGDTMGIRGDETLPGMRDGAMNSTVAYNAITLTSGTRDMRALLWEVSNSNVASYNVIDIRGASLGTIGVLTTDSDSNAYYNNTIVTNDQVAMQFGRPGESAFYTTNCIAKNNIFYAPGTSGNGNSIVRLENAKPNMLNNGHVLDYNLYSNGTAWTINIFGSGYPTPSESYNAAGIDQHSVKTVNVGFKNLASGDFRLQFGSPAIRTASNLDKAFAIGLSDASGSWPFALADQNTFRNWTIGAFVYTGR